MTVGFADLRAVDVRSHPARMADARARLLQLAAEYVATGKDGCRAERLRIASAQTGYPINLIDVEAERLGRR